MSETSPNEAKGSVWTMLALVGLVGVALVIYRMLDTGAGPPPAAIASDPFLVQGREIFVSRCASCHGKDGRGDGPLSKGLNGPKPRDFVADEWKYGTRAAQVLKVVTDGVVGTSMAGWKSSYSAEELRAVTAYLYVLAKRPVPGELRMGRIP